MRFASLGSGSKGNCLVIDAGETRVLLDCGFALREAVARLQRLGVDAASIDAVLVTHEHGDHLGGVFRFAAAFEVPVYLTHGTLRAAPPPAANGLDLRVIDSHDPFQIGPLEVQPFPVPHDAREPVQYRFRADAHRLGVLTDLGCSTPHIERTLSGCDALVIECNHDAQMLRAGNYPPALKQRVGGRYGHLDNAAAAALLGSLERDRLQHVIAAHLSEQNNRPELAREALAAALAWPPEAVGVATQSEGFPWRVLE